jgi:hypothetical protein
MIQHILINRLNKINYLLINQSLASRLQYRVPEKRHIAIAPLWNHWHASKAEHKNLPVP